MRTFHVGGIAMGGAERSTLEAKNDGILKFNNLKSVMNKEGQIIVVNRNANIAILDDRNREVEHYQVPYGAKVLFKDGEEVKARQEFAEWDPFTTFIMSEESGTAHFHDVVLGLTMEEVPDEFTGLITPVIIDPKDEKMQPQIQILHDTKKDDKGKPLMLRKYFLPSGANLEVKDGRQNPLPATCWLRFLGKPPGPKTSPVVCPALKNCSRRDDPKILLLSPRSMESSSTADWSGVTGRSRYTTNGAEKKSISSPRKRI